MQRDTKQILAAQKKAQEANRRKRLEREAQGIFKAEFMRLTLTEEAYNIIKDMPSAEFREFASEAVRRKHRMS